jgi:hypothetical protein
MTNRIVYYTNEGFYDAASDQCIVAQIVENEAGYGPWSYEPTLEQAKAVAAANNAALGVSDDDVLEVVVSSMRQGNRRNS